MNARYRTILIATVLGVVAFTGCGKQKQQTPQQQEEQNTKIVLMEDMTVSGIRLKDTINNIRGMVLFARNNIKKDDNVDLTLANKLWEDDLKSFTRKIKQMETKNPTDTSYYFLTIRSVDKYGDVVSVLYDRKYYLTGSKDTVYEFLSVNYDEDDNAKIYNFADVFTFDKSDLNKFNSVFNSSFTMEQLQSISFNFEKEDVCLNVFEGDKPVRKRARAKDLKAFLKIDD
ncbi:MAG: hypothetical protein IJ250_03125 [Bacteroidales bacterium]|nr:hypothetical protein [Bacteroidales bacterium]